MNEETKLMGGLDAGPHDFEDTEINPWLEEEQDRPPRPIYGPWHICWGMSPDEKEEWDWRHDLAGLEKIKEQRHLPPTEYQKQWRRDEEYQAECAAWGLGPECFKAWQEKKELQDYYNSKE